MVNKKLIKREISAIHWLLLTTSKLLIGIGIGVIFAAFLRFLMHFISGIVLWSNFAAEGQTAVMYSLIYDGTYMLPTTILLVIVAVAIYSPLKSHLAEEK